MSPASSAGTRGSAADANRAPQPLLEVKDLRKFFPLTQGLLRKQIGEVKAVDGVSFQIQEGETLGLVGESGSGKTTIGRMIVRIHEPTGGRILFHTEDGSIDLTELKGEELRQQRKDLQMIFQDPYSSLNPRLTVQDIVAEPLVCQGWKNKKKIRDRVAESLELAGIDPKIMPRYPHAFSGGQRQRIGIARSLAIEPRLIVADEPVSALDVSVQAQVLNVMTDLQRRLGLTYLFVAHDLGVVRHISDRVAVMYSGKLFEVAETDTLFADPKHPYTEALLSAIPRPDPGEKTERIVLQGEVADPADRPAGCAFHPRCAYAQPICSQVEPPLVNLNGPGEQPHLVACHFAKELDLQGITIAPSDPRGEGTVDA